MDEHSRLQAKLGNKVVETYRQNSHAFGAAGIQVPASDPAISEILALICRLPLRGETLQQWKIKAEQWASMVTEGGRLSKALTSLELIIRVQHPRIESTARLLAKAVAGEIKQAALAPIRSHFPATAAGQAEQERFLAGLDESVPALRDIGQRIQMLSASSLPARVRQLIIIIERCEAIKSGNFAVAA